MNNIKDINMDPVNKIINKIENANKNSIILAGEKGSGKTLILNELINRDLNNKNILIDCTIKNGEYLILKDKEIFELYHICLIIKKILMYINKKFEKEFYQNFSIFNIYIENILKIINVINVTNIYKNSTSFIDEKIYKNPEILLENLLKIIKDALDLEKITLIIDDFDKACNSSQRYQLYIYNTIIKYLNFIIAISDETVINDERKLNLLKNESEIIKINYNFIVEEVKDILDKKSVQLLIENKICNLNYRVCNFFSNELIKKMIVETKGNIYDMLTILEYLYRNIDKYSKEELDKIVMDYIINKINKNAMLTGKILTKRTLYL